MYLLVYEIDEFVLAILMAWIVFSKLLKPNRISDWWFRVALYSLPFEQLGSMGPSSSLGRWYCSIRRVSWH